MKRTVFFSLLVIVLFSVMAFAQGQRPAGAGVGVRPSSPGASVDHRPSTAGKPQSSGVSADHRTAPSTQHAVDPKDAHGFKNYGQYVAAQHVAENLQIPGGLDALKALMTGDNAISLGKAIAQLRPDLSQQAIEVEVKKADAAAKKAAAEAKKTEKGTK
jgi:hypothetical protein